MTTDEAKCIGNFIEAMEKLHKPIVIRMCWLDVSELQTSAALVWMEEPQETKVLSNGKESWQPAFLITYSLCLPFDLKGSQRQHKRERKG